MLAVRIIASSLAALLVVAFVFATYVGLAAH